jgi:hypothetical protein
MIMNGEVRKSLSKRKNSYSKYGYALLQCVIHISPVGGYNMNKGFDSAQTAGPASVIQGHLSSDAPGGSVVSSKMNFIEHCSVPRMLLTPAPTTAGRFVRNLFSSSKRLLVAATAEFLPAGIELN